MAENKEKRSEINKRYREYKRLWMFNKRHQIRNERKRKEGNEKYQALVEEERKWMENAKLCKICNYRHPPLKDQAILLTLNK